MQDIRTQKARADRPVTKMSGGGTRSIGARPVVVVASRVGAGRRGARVNWGRLRGTSRPHIPNPYRRPTVRAPPGGLHRGSGMLHSGSLGSRATWPGWPCGRPGRDTKSGWSVSVAPSGSSDGGATWERVNLPERPLAPLKSKPTSKDTGNPSPGRTKPAPGGDATTRSRKGPRQRPKTEKPPRGTRRRGKGFQTSRQMTPRGDGYCRRGISAMLPPPAPTSGSSATLARSYASARAEGVHLASDPRRQLAARGSIRRRRPDRSGSGRWRDSRDAGRRRALG